MSNRTFIICEIGSNYNGSLECALEYVSAAKAAGADAIKFQTLRRDRLVAPRVQIKGEWVDNPVYRNFLNLELPADWHFELKRRADEVGIEFFSTPFYLEAVELLERVGVRTYKIASGDITFFPLLKEVGRTGKRVILSTGASDLADIERALATLRAAGATDIALLHCVSNYPPTWDEMNLRAIVSMKERFGLNVGISDHTPGDLVPLVSVALGAKIVEKHVTFDRVQKGPDHPFAVTMLEFCEMVERVRTVELALGNGAKLPTPAESAKQHRMRRGTYDPVSFKTSTAPDALWLRPLGGPRDQPVARITGK